MLRKIRETADQFYANTLLTERLVKAVQDACLKAKQELIINRDEFGFDNDSLPHIRRKQLDRELIRIAEENTTFKAKNKPNKAKNCSHVELDIDSELILTAHKVSNPREFPRPARFRHRLQQLNMFEGAEDSKIIEIFKPLYVNLIYVVTNHTPEYIGLGFPHPLNNKNWLFYKALDLAPVSQNAKMEHIPDNVDLDIKDSKKKKKTENTNDLG